MNDKNPLQERLESTIITRTFHVSGMPEATFKEIDTFCKEHYGDNRWTMIADLMRLTKEDFKYSLLYDELESLKVKVAMLENKEIEPEEKPTNKYGTFGGN